MADFDKFSREELIDYIEDLEKQLKSNKYGLYFDRTSSPEEVVSKCQKNIPILVHQKDNDVLHGGQDNILIEGDNYACLMALNMIYDNNLVDIVCIDPPYNTGNDGFVFRDGFKHSDWLCMIEKRLKLAKNLMKETGIIYIDIDDNEYADLKLLCDSIFGAENFLSDFIWLNNMKGRQISTGGAVKTYEHILLYAKNADLIPTFEGDIRELSAEMPLVYKDAKYNVMTDNKGKFIVKNELYNTNSAFNEETRPNLVFNIYYNPKTKDVATCGVDQTNDYLDKGYILISPHKNADGRHKYHAWRWSKDKIKNETDDLYFFEDRGVWKVSTKLRDIYSTNIKDVISNSTNGNAEIEDILGKGKFSYPKPVKLIKRLIKNFEKVVDDSEEGVAELAEPIVIFDFFAGSGTTAQAVLELNKEDGKNRIFILNTLNEISEATELKYLKQKKMIPEKLKKEDYQKFKEIDEYKKFVNSDEYSQLGICRSVTLQRLKTVITGIRSDGTKYSNGLPGSLRYFKVDFVPDSSLKEQAKYNLVEQCDGLLCVLEGCYDKLCQGISYNIYQNSKADKSLSIFNDNYDDKLITEMLDVVAKMKFKENVIYYFSLDSNVDTSIETKVLDKIPNAIVKPIPSKIYEVYKKLVEESERIY